MLFNIVEETKTTGLWNKLESLYMKNNFSNKIFLKRQVYSLRMKEDAIDYDIVVGALLSEEIRKTSSKETSTIEAMMIKGRSTERGKNQRGTSRSKSKGKKSK